MREGFDHGSFGNSLTHVKEKINIVADSLQHEHDEFNKTILEKWIKDKKEGNTVDNQEVLMQIKPPVPRACMMVYVQNYGNFLWTIWWICLLIWVDLNVCLCWCMW